LHIAYKPEFFDDLDDIFKYISENFNSDLATKVVSMIYNGTKVLADQPFLGREYSHNPYFRHFIVKKRIWSSIILKAKRSQFIACLTAAVIILML
jgi:plasmid stabilization system protein ParE